MRVKSLDVNIDHVLQTIADKQLDEYLDCNDFDECDDCISDNHLCGYKICKLEKFS